MSTQGSSGSGGSGRKSGSRSGPENPAEAVTRIIGHLTTLVSQEIALVKAQLSEAVAHFGKAAGAGGAAAVLALYMLGFFGVAGALGLTRVVPDWAAYLIVGGVFLLLTLIALLVARSQANKGSAAPSVATNQVKEDVAWAKQQIKR